MSTQDNNTIERQNDEITLRLTPDQFAGMQTMLHQMDSVVRHDAAKEAAPATVTAPVTARAPRKRRSADTMNTQATGPQISNQPPTFETLLAVASILGADAGKGSDTQVKFDLKVAEGSYLGVIDTAPNKHGDGRNDATLLAEAYVQAQQGAVQFDAKAPNQRKLISNVQKMIRLGGSPKFGVGEPLGTINNLVSMRQKLRAVPGNSKKLDDAHNMLMRYATIQLKRDTLIDGDELRSFAFKRETEVRSAEDVLEAIKKMAMNLKLGKVPNCPDLDNSKEVQDIIKAAQHRLAAIAKARAEEAGTATP